jgi:hypothetical protein
MKIATVTVLNIYDRQEFYLNFRRICWSCGKSHIDYTFEISASDRFRTFVSVLVVLQAS